MHSKDIPIIPEEPPLYEGEFHEERGAMNWSFDKLTNLVKGVEYSHL